VRETREMIVDGNGLKLYIRDDAFEGTFSIAGRQKDASGNIFAISAVALHPVTDGEAIHPFLTLQQSTMQNLFNQMWQLGFRPKDGTGNSGHIEALKYHLEDMRQLVFKGSKK
jgi:hypothetical protein